MNTAAALSALVLAASLGLAARAPVAFKMINVFSEAPLPAFEVRDSIDIAKIVRAIPDRGAAGTADAVYAAHPGERYERSVVQGFGNCSNLVKGLSWGLLRDGHEFEIVYVLPPASYLEGGGHTILRARLALPEGPRVGLVDVAAAAVPRSAGQVLDVGDLHHVTTAAYLDQVRPESEDWAPFYTAEFLRGTVIGRTSSAETAHWFRFVEAIYVDLGVPEKLDKIVYAGIGVVLGVMPPIHVDAHDLELMRAQHPYRFAQMSAALWGLRVAPLVLLGCGLSWLVQGLRRRSGTVECRDFAGAGS